MPGILGVVKTTTNEEVVKTYLQGMINPMRRREWFNVEKCTLPGAGLASVSLIDEKTIAERGSVLLTYEGEIVDQEKLRARLLASGERGAHHYRLSEMLLALYLRFGAQALCGLNGIYVIAVWDGEQRKLTLLSDRYGIGKLFYWITNDQLMFASEMKAITWHPGFNKKISELGFSHFLASGRMMDDLTLFEDIKVLPQACLAIYQNGQFSIDQYWDYNFFDPGSKIKSEKEYIDELAHRTRAAVWKTVQGDRTCLLLTGGLDSRTIAGMYEQCNGGPALITSTIGLEQCKDVQFAREISQHLGLEHHLIPIGPDYLAVYADDFSWVTDGIETVLGCWISAAWEFLLDHQIRFAITGLNGELLSGKHWKDYWYKGIDEDHYIRILFHNEGRQVPEIMDKILKPIVYRNVAGESFKSFERSFKSAASQNVLNKFEKLWSHQNMRRTAIGPYVLGDYARVFEPFFDNDLVDWVLQIPPELRMGGKLTRKMLVKYVPKLVHSSYRTSGQCLKSFTYKENSALMGMFLGARSRIRRKYFPATKKAKEEHLLAFFPFDEWLRNEAKIYILNVLNRREYLEDLFDMQAVDQLVTDHMEGRKNEFWLIGLLVTFSLWRQQFCGQ